MRTISSLLVISGSLFTLIGCEGLGGTAGDDASGGSGATGGSGAGGSGGGVEKLCDIIDDVGNNTSQGSTLSFETDRSLEPGCTYRFAAGFYVYSGTLTVPEGVTLISDFHFGVDGGTLKIEGTEENPVTVKVGEFYSDDPTERVHSGFYLLDGTAELSHVNLEGQDGGPRACMTIAGDEANLSVSLEDVSLRQCHVAGIRFEDFDLVTHGGPYEGPQMPIKTFNNVTIADAPHGYYVQDTFLTPLPGEATFENVPSNFVLLSSYQDTPEPRRLAKTSIPWETQGFTADGTIVVEAGVELVIRDEACQFDNLCSNGDFSYGNGELRLEGTEADPITIRPKTGETIGAHYAREMRGSHVNFVGPFEGDGESCALYADNVELTDVSITNAPGLIALCVANDVSTDRFAFNEAAYGFRVRPMQAKNIGSSNTYTQVPANYMQANAGLINLTGPNTWSNQGVPWFVNGDLQVLSGGVLTLQAGVELDLAGSGFFLEGDIIGNGTAGSPIVFSGPSYSIIGVPSGSLSLTNAQFKGPSQSPINASNLGSLSLTNVTFEPGMSITGACGATNLVNTTVNLQSGC